MRTALAITHVAFEDLGTLGEELTRAGYAVEVLDACTADLRSIDPVNPGLLVILGGPIGVYDQGSYPFLNAELELIRSRLAAQRPIIGICLGAQLMAAACGASVYAGTQGKEIGWGPIQAGPDAALCPEFSGLLPSDLHVFHWHGDTFDLPANSHHLAKTDAYPNQAFAIGRHALALQFHPEVTSQGLESWYVGHASELNSAGISVASLRQDSETFAPALENAARHFWREWLSSSADGAE